MVPLRILFNGSLLQLESSVKTIPPRTVNWFFYLRILSNVTMRYLLRIFTLAYWC